MHVPTQGRVSGPHTLHWPGARTLTSCTHRQHLDHDDGQRQHLWERERERVREIVSVCEYVCVTERDSGSVCGCERVPVCERDTIGKYQVMCTLCTYIHI